MGSVDAVGIAILMHFFGIIMFIIGAPIVAERNLRKEQVLYRGGILNLLTGLSFIIIAGIILADQTDWYLSLVMLFSTSLMLTFIFIGATSLFILGKKRGMETANMFFVVAFIFATISIALSTGGIDAERGGEVLGFT